MGASEDAKHLVAEPLADDLHAREVEGHVLEIRQPRDQPLRLGARDERMAESGQLDRRPRTREAQRRGIGIGGEDVLETPHVPRNDLQLDPGAAPDVARPDAAVAYIVVDDPCRLLALEAEARDRLRGEEETFPAVPARIAGELPLLELEDRIPGRREAEVVAEAPEDTDPVVRDRRHGRPAPLEAHRDV